jgi:hypothetical protein
MKRVKHEIEGVEVVHYEGCISDYTLCGHDTEDTKGSLIDEYTAGKDTDEDATCQQCLLIEAHVLGYK